MLFDDWFDPIEDAVRERVPLVWTQMAKLADEFLPKPQILHPWPSVRFAVRHPR
jgi:RNA-directed DNA polymerase